jgi:lipopolysaccharide/colanic/teichoic acid biosynthesis glycosyltransferase
MDLVGAGFLLLALTPVLVAVAVAVLVCDGRPILFRQVRVGRGGRHFRIVKFRTMVRDAEQRLGEVRWRNERQGPLFKVSHDPRVTGLGRFLRATSLDELPQLVNVLAGSMSLVGPRPALPSEVDSFDEALLERHHVRPGMTGPWQITTGDMNDFDQYRRLDLDYVRTWSVLGDLGLIARTCGLVVDRGARVVAKAALPRRGPAPPTSLAPSTLGLTEGLSDGVSVIDDHLVVVLREELAELLIEDRDRTGRVTVS